MKVREININKWVSEREREQQRREAIFYLFWSFASRIMNECEDQIILELENIILACATQIVEIV